MKTPIDEKTIEDFRLYGVAVIRKRFDDWVEPLRRGITDNLENPGPHARVYQGQTGEGRFLSDYCNWERIPDYRRFIFESDAAEIAADLMGCNLVRLFHEHVLIKEAQAGVPTPWHQDQPYYCVEAPKTVSLWIPLDEVPRERTLEFVAGSHLWGKLYRPQLASVRFLRMKSCCV